MNNEREMKPYVWTRIKAHAYSNRTAMIQALTDEGYSVRVIRDKKRPFAANSGLYIEFCDQQEDEE